MTATSFLLPCAERLSPHLLVRHPAALGTGASGCFLPPHVQLKQQLYSSDPMDSRAQEFLDQRGRLHSVKTVASGMLFALCLAGVGGNSLVGRSPRER